MSDDLQPELNAALQLLRERALKTQNGGILSGCTSFVSRRLGCGHNRATCILEHLEKAMLITRANERGERRLLP